MSHIHDQYAAFASAEVARLLVKDVDQCLPTISGGRHVAAWASRHSRDMWPHADGVITLEFEKEFGEIAEKSIGFEFKRDAEGLHGVLTALGQSHAYLINGFHASIICIPNSYQTYNGNIGDYLADVINKTSAKANVGVFTYKHPDLTSSSPFYNKIEVHKYPVFDNLDNDALTTARVSTETQWAHVREGSTESDAFYKLLLSILFCQHSEEQQHMPVLPVEILRAVTQIDPTVNPYHYLSKENGNHILDRAWRVFWFRYVLHEANLVGWSQACEYTPNRTASKILRMDDKGYKVFFLKGVRPKLCKKLNNFSIGSDEACIDLVTNYRDRAHSYRQDIEKGAMHIGFLTTGGDITPGGYAFISACQKSDSANSPKAKALLAKALMNEGGFSAFLHYFHTVSNKLFSENVLAFCNAGNPLQFDKNDYIKEIQNQFANYLRILKLGVSRGGTESGNERAPFQAELALLGSLGLIQSNKARYRAGMGLVINWPLVTGALEAQ